jgi:hypothetical protein
MTRDLSEQSRDLRLKCEVPVEHEECSDATEIDRREEILQVEIQNISSSTVFRRVGNDGTIAFESVRQLIFEPSCLIDFLRAVLQKIRQIPLQ